MYYLYDVNVLLLMLRLLSRRHCCCGVSVIFCGIRQNSARRKRNPCPCATLRCPPQLHKNGQEKLTVNRWSVVWLLCVQAGTPVERERVPDRSLRRQSSTKKVLVHSAKGIRALYA